MLVAVNVTVWELSSAPPPGPTPVTVMSVAPVSSSTCCCSTASYTGGSLTASTVIVKVSVEDSTCGDPAGPSSVAVRVTVTTPLASAAGSYVTVRVAPVPETVGVGTTDGSLLVAVNVTVWLASSAPPPGPTSAIESVCSPGSSDTVASVGAVKVGASLMAFTVIVNVSATWFTPSSAVRVMVATPAASASGA